MKRPGSVIVATTADGLSTVVERLSPSGAELAERRVAGADRVLVIASFDSRERAQGVVSDLREAGELAVVGPSPSAEGSSADLIAWRKHTAPVWVDASTCISPPWSDFDRSEAVTAVEIDPGSGFGSGGHPTTLLVLRSMIDRGIAGRTVLDVGSGSGVLSVVAARLGAAAVTALDVDAAAERATLVNAGLNDVADLVTVVGHDLSVLTDGFDVVVANIHAPILIDLAPELRRLTDPGGWLGLSGISPAQISMVSVALRPLVVVDERRLDDWSALVLTHPETIG